MIRYDYGIALYDHSGPVDLAEPFAIVCGQVEVERYSHACMAARAEIGWVIETLRGEGKDMGIGDLVVRRPAAQRDG